MSALEEAQAEVARLRSLIDAMREEAQRLAPMANAISFLEDGGTKWAPRVDRCRANLVDLAGRA